MVNSVTEATEISAGNGFLKYTADSGKYGIVNVTLKNTFQSSSTFSLSSFQLVCSDGAEYSPTIIAAADENYILLPYINVNKEKHEKHIKILRCIQNWSGSKERLICQTYHKETFALLPYLY